MNDSATFGMLGLLIGGAGVWAVMRVKIAAMQDDLWSRPYTYAELNEMKEGSDGFIGELLGQIDEERAAHSRLSDAHNTQSARIERALACVTDRSAHVGKKMAAILRGERV